jgi:hypothetical protein
MPGIRRIPPSFLLINLIIVSLFTLLLGDPYAEQIDGRPASEFRGYQKREHSLTKPYQGSLLLFPFSDYYHFLLPRCRFGHSELGYHWQHYGSDGRNPIDQGHTKSTGRHLE